MPRQHNLGEGPVRDGSGKSRGSVAATRVSPELKKSNAKLKQEIQDLRIADAALSKSEERFRLMVQNAHEGIFIAAGGMFRFLNPRIVEIIGHPMEDLLSRPFTEFIHPNHRGMVLQRHYKKIQ